MKRILLILSICLFWQSYNAMAQADARNKLCLKILKDGTNGDEWHFNTYQDLLNRASSPRITVRSGEIDDDFYPNGGSTYFEIFDLSNNNIKGDLPNFNKAETYVNDAGETVQLIMQGLFGTQRVKGIILSHNEITSVDYTDINRTHKKLHSHLDRLKLDNNKIKEFKLNWHERRGGIGVGMLVLFLHQNEITSLNSSHFPYETFKYNNVLANKMDTLRVDNNRLNFNDLIDLYDFTTKILTIYHSQGVSGNENFHIDYYPQKPLGGDATEETLANGASKTLQFSLTHSDNHYQWTLNGKDVPEADQTTYELNLSDATAGVWRCKVTNPNLPEVELFSYDMAVFMEKSGNQAVSDFNFSHGTIVSNFPEAAIVGDFSGSDPDGDQLYYRLPDRTADNSHFRIINGKTLISSEELFERSYIEKYTIQVEAYDIFGGKFTKEFVIEKGEATGTPFPSDVKLSANVLEENTPNFSIGNFSIEGVDASYGYQVTLPAEMEDNDLFLIESGVLKNKEGFDFESRNEYMIRTKAVATDGTSFEKTFNIKVTDINDAPHDILLSNDRFAINNSIGYFVGYLNAIDQDQDDNTFTYSLKENFEDNTFFSISNNKLIIKAKIIEAQILTIGVNVKDEENKEFFKEFNISVYDENFKENDPPTEIGLSNTVIYKTIEVGDTIASINMTDPNGDKGTFTLTDDTHFGISNNQLILKKETTLGEAIEIEITGDDGDYTIKRSFKIYTVNPIIYNQYAPTAIGLTNNVVLTSNIAGESIAEIVMSDPDGDEGIYTLNSEYFEIDGSSLILKSRPDQTMIEIEIIANDGINELKKKFPIYFAVNIENTNVVEDISTEEKLLIYPNPTKDKLYVSKPGQIRIYNTTGKLLINKSVNDHINISNLETGMYVIILESESVYYEYKIIKE